MKLQQSDRDRLVALLDSYNKECFLEQLKNFGIGITNPADIVRELRELRNAADMLADAYAIAYGGQETDSRSMGFKNGDIEEALNLEYNMAWDGLLHDEGELLRADKEEYLRKLVWCTELLRDLKSAT